ncbi:MAG: hypothetical protein JWQ68_746, partial [Cryobacterium sp.]|nr:hypothetical protein [Cryobacterium sp.]
MDFGTVLLTAVPGRSLRAHLRPHRANPEALEQPDEAEGGVHNSE